MEETAKPYFIEYLNKDKNFTRDKKYFSTYDLATKWAKKTFEKFDPDMIRNNNISKTKNSPLGKAGAKFTSADAAKIRRNFKPETNKDYLALFLDGVKFSPESFDRFFDSNMRKKGSQALNLRWIKKGGSKVDQLALSVISGVQGYNNADETDTINDIVDLISTYAGGLTEYFYERNNEVTNEDQNNYYMSNSNIEDTDDMSNDAFAAEMKKLHKKTKGKTKTKIITNTVVKTVKVTSKKGKAKTSYTPEFAALKRAFNLHSKKVNLTQLNSLVQVCRKAATKATEHKQLLKTLVARLDLAIFKLDDVKTILNFEIGKDLLIKIENIVKAPKVKAVTLGGAKTKLNKLSKSQKEYNKEVDLYKWYVVMLKRKVAIGGYEFKQDAIDIVKQIDDSDLKVVAKSALKKFGVTDPTQNWKLAGFDSKKPLSGTFTSEQKQAVKEAETDLKNAYTRLTLAKKNGITGTRLKIYVDGVQKYIQAYQKAKGILPKANAKDKSQTSLFEMKKTNSLFGGLGAYQYEGKNYRRTADLNLKELAELIRIEVSAEYSKQDGYKISVKTDNNTITVMVLEAPFNPFSIPYQIMYVDDISWNDFYNELRNDNNHRIEKYNDKALKLVEKTEKILSQYNYDDSDIMTDYFHRRFYARVEFEDTKFIDQFYPNNVERKLDKERAAKWNNEAKAVNAKAKEIREANGNYKRNEIVWLKKELHPSWKKYLQPNGRYYAVVTKAVNGHGKFTSMHVAVLKESNNEETWNKYIELKNSVAAKKNSWDKKMLESYYFVIDGVMYKPSSTSVNASPENLERVNAPAATNKKTETKSDPKIKLDNVLIHWAEGDNAKFDKFPKKYKTWESANKAVVPILEDDIIAGGYNKVKFTVTFTDGEVYDGRLDVSVREDNPTTTSNVFGDHIKDYLNYLLSSKAKTPEADKAEIESWLKKYDLGSSKALSGIKKKSVKLSGLNSIMTRSDLEKAAKKVSNPFGTMDKLTSGGTYQLNGELGKLLGNLGEVDTSITIKGDQGAGKTQLMWQMVNAFASIGKKVAIDSTEMNGNSPTVTKYRDQFISEENKSKILFTDKKLSVEEIVKLANSFDVIFIDSFNHLKDYEQKQFEWLAKQLPSKAIVGLFQSTTSGEMRGGNKPEFDAYINIECVKVDDTFKNNYAVCTKNRFGSTGQQYNISKQKIQKANGLSGVASKRKAVKKNN